MVLRVIAGVLCCFVVSYCVGLIHLRARSHGRPLPPGPIGLPFAGNIFHMRQPALWTVLDKLCKAYGEFQCHSPIKHSLMWVRPLTGDVIHMSVFGEHIVVLGSPQAVGDLLDHRSAVTSDRQQSPLIEL